MGTTNLSTAAQNKYFAPSHARDEDKHIRTRHISKFSGRAMVMLSHRMSFFRCTSGITTDTFQSFHQSQQLGDSTASYDIYPLWSSSRPAFLLSYTASCAGHHMSRPIGSLITKSNT
ncbi:hypothetical protein E2C01_058162 [Portunus trituberculatus]|uniref:Uncharacterized protein n=1 Tax=Portunus trituberculatus TaxID=210409 RepID=A0A5B7GZ39_PORTR|nr:hypothetical protein [Portunus trituberculatus]